MLLYIVNIILAVLPDSRFYAFKRILLRLTGAVIGDNVRMMSFKLQGVKLVIRDNTFIGNETLITGGTNSKVQIGENCDISSRVIIATGSHVIGDINQAAGAGYSKDITIENGVWIGIGSIILNGVTIGRGSVIAAGSVVTSNIPAGVLAAGVPAKVKRTLY